jgi:hypothetical protein
MKTKSGWLHLTKGEQKEIRLLLEHSRRDIDFGGGGSFSKYDNENTFDEKEADKVRRGIEAVEWILETYCGK